MFAVDLTQPFWRALGWALLHSLWQGGLLAVVLAGALSLLKGRSASLRYALACAALALMLAAPVATFWSFRSAATGVEVDEISLARHGRAGFAIAPEENSSRVEKTTNADVGVEGRTARQAPARSLERLLSWLSLAWLLCVLMLSARMLGGVLVARRLKLRADEVAAEWQQKLAELSGRLHVRRRVRLLESARVQVPTVVGWLRPVILVPASVFVGLTPLQLEVLLAHELAHVRRHDYFVNLLQTLAETLLFYHPAVWWVSRRVRVEREHACDDMAVAACGDALVYARALTTLERVRASRTRLALAADGGDLRSRVSRLVGSTREPHVSSSPLVGTLLLVALVGGGGFAFSALSQRNPVAARTSDAAHDKAESVAFKGGTADEGMAANESGATDDSRSVENSQAQALSTEVAQLIAADVTDGEDAEVRRAAVAALGDRAGAVVVMDARTGRVYTVVNQEWALRRGWQPASLMKLVTAMAGIESKSFDPSAKTRVAGRSWRLDLTDALAISDNDYFKTLSERVGTEKLVTYARGVGLGEPTGVNYESESAGRVPEAAGQSASRLGAFGEGVEVTPIQLATLVAAIANGGALLTPQVPRGRQSDAEVAPLVRRRIEVSRETLARVVAGMTAVVERGTGAGAKGAAPKLAGKTGSLAMKDASLGLFASFAPADDPRLVVVVLARGRGESGPAVAGIAGVIYKSLGSRM
jgi:beta-lactamase regulating signal transducer with metallopeptidase domain